MAADFKLITSYVGGEPCLIIPKASATVIEAGDMVTVTSGLAVKAGAASAVIGFTPYGAIAGELSVKVLDDKNAIFEGTGAANFAVAQRGTEVDMSGTTDLLINSAASTTDVFKIDTSINAGTVGSTAKIIVRINKPIY